MNGIIPTRMGTSIKLIPYIKPKQDHPHAYGDKSAVLRVDEYTVGSSPRVWGQEEELQ